MQKVKKINKTVLIIVSILIGITLYGIYFYNSNIYKEFEETEATKELIPYEEEKQNNNSNEEKRNNEIDEHSNINTNDEIIIVHITGAVKNWGIIELPTNSRMADAIEKAGGLTADADISRINLAYILEDGMKINIPSSNTTIENETNESNEDYISKGQEGDIISFSGKRTTDKINLVNINTATQTELETLPGIGTSTALKIINYRDENGKFEAIDDIKNVSGIGESKFNNIKHLIKI